MGIMIQVPAAIRRLWAAAPVPASYVCPPPLAIPLGHPRFGYRFPPHHSGQV